MSLLDDIESTTTDPRNSDESVGNCFRSLWWPVIAVLIHEVQEAHAWGHCGCGEPGAVDPICVAVAALETQEGPADG